MDSKQKKVLKQAKQAYAMYQSLGTNFSDEVFHSETGQDMMTVWDNKLNQRLAWLKKHLDKKTYDTLEF